MKQELSRGAEAIIYKDKDIIKERVPKSYRLREIDEKLRRFRTRREGKVLNKLQNIGFPAPVLVDTDEKSVIEMDFINGTKIRDAFSQKNFKKLAAEIGKKIALMHNAGIIHGDLTTSNMILAEEIYFIDFGLSFFSNKVEDKAVDLHLLKQALESRHYKIWESCFKSALSAYKKEAKGSDDILKRLAKVEMRGRYKKKGNMLKEI